MLEIIEESHTDHITPSILTYIKDRYADKNEFFSDTFELPSSMRPLYCDLIGPYTTGLKVTKDLVWLAKRPNREGYSPLLAANPFATREITVIAGPVGASPCVLYTAYAGPQALREPWDMCPKEDPEAYDRSLRFWSEHALCRPAGMSLMKVKEANYDQVLEMLQEQEIRSDDIDRIGQPDMFKFLAVYKDAPEVLEALGPFLPYFIF